MDLASEQNLPFSWSEATLHDLATLLMHDPGKWRVSEVRTQCRRPYALPAAGTHSTLASDGRVLLLLDLSTDKPCRRSALRATRRTRRV